MPAVVAGPGGGAVLDGVLERVTFANLETGYTIARIAPERGGADLITAVGPLLGAQIGELLRLRGRWSSHPLTTSSWMMLQRNLLYTGITRARKLVVLAGSRRALAAAIRTKGAGRRHTACIRTSAPPEQRNTGLGSALHHVVPPSPCHADLIRLAGNLQPRTQARYPILPNSGYHDTEYFCTGPYVVNGRLRSSNHPCGT